MAPPTKGEGYKILRATWSRGDKKEFGLSHLTLEDLLAHEPEQWRIPTFTKTDKALSLAEINQANVEDLRKEIKELKEQFSKFQETVSSQVADKFLKPLVSQLRLPPELESKPEPDNLKLDMVPQKFNVIQEAELLIGQAKSIDQLRDDLLCAYEEAYSEGNWKLAHDLFVHEVLTDDKDLDRDEWIEKARQLLGEYERS